MDANQWRLSMRISGVVEMRFSGFLQMCVSGGFLASELMAVLNAFRWCNRKRIAGAFEANTQLLRNFDKMAKLCMVA